MNPLDALILSSSKYTKVNYVGVTGCDPLAYRQEETRAWCLSMVKQHPKLRYKIVPFCGDYYYQEMSVEETMAKAYQWWDEDKALKNADELDLWVEDNINMKLPFDGPQFRAIYQHLTNQDGEDQVI